MMQHFKMTNLGLMNYFLGMEVDHGPTGIFICQKKYVEGLLKKYKMESCNPVTTPLQVNEKLCKDDGSKKADEKVYRSMIGSLMYLTSTRPDLMFSTSLLSRFMHNPSQLLLLRDS